MAREVSYELQTINHPNPIARYAHQSRYKKSLEVTASLLPQGGAVLDFGAGQGELLHRLAERRPDVFLIAYEPYMTLKYPEIEHRLTMTEIESNSVDLLCAFETLEHVSDEEIDLFVSEGKRILKPNSKVVVSVPIMHGAALPIKELSRALLFRPSQRSQLC